MGSTRLELVAPAVGERALVERDREALEKTDGNVAVLERERLEEETTGNVDALRVRAPVLNG